MKVATLALLSVCLSGAGCSAGNTAASNPSATQTTNGRTAAADSNAANNAPAGAAPAQKDAPDAVVRELYKQHDSKNSPFFQTKDRAAVDKYFTRKLADLIWKDAVGSEGEVGALGADPLYDAQDSEITDFKIRPEQADGDRALVLVTFKNFGKARSLTFNVERESGAWKISNITGDDYNLLNTLEAAAKGN